MALPELRTASPRPAPLPRAGFGALPELAIHVAVTGFINLGLLVIAPEGVPVERLAAATVLLWLAAYPTFDIVRRTEKRSPLFPLVNLMYFVYFGLPVFTGSVTVRGDARFESPTVTTAVVLADVGLLAMQLAFYGTAGVAKRLPRVHLRIDFEPLVKPFLALGFFGAIASGWMRVGSFPAELRAIVNVLAQIPLLLLAALLVMHLRGKLTRGQSLFAGLSYLIFVAMSFASGAMAQVAFTMAPMFFAYVAERGKIPWRAGLVCILLSLPFAYTKQDFRKELQGADLGPVDRVERFFELTWEKSNARDARVLEGMSKTSSHRTSYLGTFAYVVLRTPERVPYWEGESYARMMWSFAPRIITPDRPALSVGQEFGHRYNILDHSDYHTSVNCAQIIEMYMNFGQVGVLVGMAIVGLFYRLLYGVLNHGDGDDGASVLSAIALAGLLNIESDSANVLIGAVHTALIGGVALYGIALLAGGRRRAA